jgi:acyl-CoA reductase-like NAD-dependent aldehyde dehydrogenase
MSAPTLSVPWQAETDRARAAQTCWASMPIRERIRPLVKLRRQLVVEADALCDAVLRDIGRPAAEVLSTDIAPTAEAIRFLERRATRILRPARVAAGERPIWLWGQRDVIYRRPHGVVGIIGTWNYPIFLNTVQISQALTAGNAVLWKPSEFMPTTAARLHQLFLQAGYPVDLVQMLPATREAGPELLEAEIDHLVFTGSGAVGRRIAARLGERLMSSTLELSGIDAVFVCADADLLLAARAVWFGITLNKGQTCLAVRRIFVDRSIYPPFIDMLQKIGSKSTAMTLVLPSQATQADALLRDAASHGATIWRAVTNHENAHAMSPALVIDARPEMRICHEPVFAPVAAVIPYDTLEEAIRSHESCEYGLGAAIFTAEHRQVASWAARLKVGVVTVNDVIVPTAHPATPFGGRKASGWGVTQGAEGLLGMTVPQVVSVRTGTWRPHYEPLDEASPISALLRGWLHWQHGDTRTRWSGLWTMLTAAYRACRKHVF